MSSDATADGTARLAAPRRLKRRPSVLGLAWRIHWNSLAAWTEEAYREEFLTRHLLFRRVFVANSPEAARHVLLDRAENYVKSRIARQLLKPLGQGLLTSEGALWRRQRRTLAPAFHPKRLEAFTAAMVQAAADMLAGWDALPAGSVVDAAEAMAGLTLDIITRTMFSSDIRERAAEVRASLVHYQRVGGRPSLADLLGLPGWVPRVSARRVRAATAALDDIIFGIIERRRREAGPADDLLGLLLATHDEESGEGMSDAQLRDEIATIFTAGHETTANALTWTWYLLALHPQVEARLLAELAAVLGGRLAADADIPRLRYTRMVLEESLRLYPPAHTLSREAIEDDEILGHRIPAGSAVLISPWLLHRHEMLWERPEIFDPERFTPERASARPRYAYLPFGGGPRICIGAGFAMQEATIILATVAQHYRLRLVPGQRVEPLGLITLRPKGGLLMALERRAR
jgi:cytochrome P450